MKGKISKAKILLMPDMPGWAYDNRADKIREYLSGEYDFSKTYYDGAALLPERERAGFLKWEKYDCVFPFFWRHLQWLGTYPDMDKAMTGVFSFKSWEAERDEFVKEINRYRALVVNSYDLFLEIRKRHPNVFYTPNGVDENIFCPRKQARGSQEDFVVGWAGNPDYSHSGSVDHKGYHTIFLPAVQAMDGVELKTALRGEGQIPHDEMPGFYQELDAYVSVSASESSPNPILEALATGIPVITTAKGSADLVQDGYNGLIIERDQASLQKAIQRLREDTALKQKLAGNARQSILDNWTYRKVMVNYKKAFDFVLEL
jgi:glycosyltransferase involved in cell wall biosynthesis